ncbi:MAG: hypothetical protein GYB68_18725 [Chloroflexi bacterium]|nr:hypothetical protein [Chloroflexota bacterium]
MRRVSVLLPLIVLLLLACGPANVPVDEIFPPQTGEFSRTSGPFYDPETEVDLATYEGPSGSVILHSARVGPEEAAYAVTQLPQAALNEGYDPGLGQREGVFFSYAGEFHAAWHNGDWVFVIFASSPEARVNFLSGYGY